jgi:hypothetical protein
MSLSKLTMWIGILKWERNFNRSLKICNGTEIDSALHQSSLIRERSTVSKRSKNKNKKHFCLLQAQLKHISQTPKMRNLVFQLFSIEYTYCADNSEQIFIGLLEKFSTSIDVTLYSRSFHLPICYFQSSVPLKYQNGDWLSSLPWEPRNNPRSHSSSRSNDLAVFNNGDPQLIQFIVR